MLKAIDWNAWKGQLDKTNVCKNEVKINAVVPHIHFLHYLTLSWSNKRIAVCHVWSATHLQPLHVRVCNYLKLSEDGFAHGLPH